MLIIGLPYTWHSLGAKWFSPVPILPLSSLPDVIFPAPSFTIHALEHTWLQSFLSKKFFCLWQWLSLLTYESKHGDYIWLQ